MKHCRVYWGSHGCSLERGHDGPHICSCAIEEGRTVTQPRYEVLICPVCLEQVGEPNREESGWHHHDGWGEVEPMHVEVHPAWPASLREEAIDALQPQREEQAKLKAEREAFAALPKAERDRIKRERYEALSPEGKAMHNLIEATIKDVRDDLSRTAWGGFTVIPNEQETP